MPLTNIIQNMRKHTIQILHTHSTNTITNTIITFYKHYIDILHTLEKHHKNIINTLWKHSKKILCEHYINTIQNIIVTLLKAPCYVEDNHVVYVAIVLLTTIAGYYWDPCTKCSLPAGRSNVHKPMNVPKHTEFLLKP